MEPTPRANGQPGSVRDGSRRGQSGIDFVIGFAVFFLALGFVVSTIPELLSPFGAQEGPVVADRALATLTDSLLVAGPVGGLNESCTVDFFTETGNCDRFDAGDPTTDLLGVSDSYQLNVTVEANVTGDGQTEVLCYDGADVVSCSGGERLARGPTPPGDRRTVTVARRVARLDDRTVFVKLRAW